MMFKNIRDRECRLLKKSFLDIIRASIAYHQEHDIVWSF